MLWSAFNGYNRSGQELAGKSWSRGSGGHRFSSAGGNGARTAAGREGLKTGEDTWGLAEIYHGVNNPPLARVWSNHRLPEKDNGAQMAAATTIVTKQSGMLARICTAAVDSPEQPRYTFKSCRD